MTYLDAKTVTTEGSNGIAYAHRRLGPQGGRPLVLLQHFRGNLDNWDPDLIDAIGEPTTVPEGFLHAFFTDSAASRTAGQQFLSRIFSRAEGRDEQTSWQTRNAQYDAVMRWGTPNFGLLQRLAAIEQPVFIASIRTPPTDSSSSTCRPSLPTSTTSLKTELSRRAMTEQVPHVLDRTPVTADC